MIVDCTGTFQTVTERSKKDRIKEKRKAALEARLAKVKQRKKLKTGDLGLDVEGKVHTESARNKKVEFVNNVDPDMAAHDEPLHLDLRCLPCCLCKGLW